VSDYRIDALARDVVGLIDAYDRETAAVAGHDWGAAVGWWLALHHADRVSEFVAVNVPHPTVFERALRTSWTSGSRAGTCSRSSSRSSPRRSLAPGTGASPCGGFGESSDPGTFSGEDFRRYRRAWNREGAFEAMVNWYRAIVRDRPTPATETVEVPTLVIWGAKDRFLSTRLAGESVDRCADGRLLILDTATHWVVHEDPHRVAKAIADHADPLPRARGSSPPNDFYIDAGDDEGMTIDRYADAVDGLAPDAGEVETAELAVTDDVLVKAFALGPGATVEPHEHGDATNVFPRPKASRPSFGGTTRVALARPRSC